METKHVFNNLHPILVLFFWKIKADGTISKLFGQSPCFGRNIVWKRWWWLEKKSFIVALRLSGHSINQISRQIDCGCNIYMN